MLHSLFHGSAIIANEKTDKNWFYELFIQNEALPYKEAQFTLVCSYALFIHYTPST